MEASNNELQQDFNNLQLQLVAIQEKLLSIEKGHKSPEAILPKLLSIFYRIQLITWKVHPSVGKLVKGVYACVAILLNHAFKFNEEIKPEQHPKEEIKVVVNQVRQRPKNTLQIIELQQRGQNDQIYPNTRLKMEEYQRIQANDIKIRRQMQQFIKCVHGIQQNSQSFFKTIMMSQDVKVEGIEFINQIIKKSNQDREKLSSSLEKLYNYLINHFKQLLNKSIHLKDFSEKQKQLINLAMKDKENKVPPAMSNLLLQSVVSRRARKVQGQTQSTLTAQQVDKLEIELKIKIIQLQNKEKQIKNILNQVYTLKKKIDTQQIQQNSQKDEISSTKEAFDELQKNFMKVCQYAASVQNHHMDFSDQLDAVSNLGLQEYVDQREFSQFSMNFKVSLINIFKKVVSRYSKVNHQNRQIVDEVRRRTISEGGFREIIGKFKHKKISLMNPVSKPLGSQQTQIVPIEIPDEQDDLVTSRSIVSNKNSFVENFIKKHLTPQNSVRNTSIIQSQPPTGINKRVTKGSINRLGGSFGWKNDHSNQELNQMVQNNVNRKIQIPTDQIQNNSDLQKTFIRNRFKSKPQAKQARKSRNLSIKKQNQESLLAVCEQVETQKQINSPKSKKIANQSWGLRKNINDMMLKADKQKRHREKSNQKLNNNDTIDEFVAGNVSSKKNRSRESVQLRRGSGEDSTSPKLDKLRSNNNKEHQNTRKIAATKINNVSINFEKGIEIEESEQGQQFEGMRLLPVFTKKNSFKQARSRENMQFSGNRQNQNPSQFSSLNKTRTASQSKRSVRNSSIVQKYSQHPTRRNSINYNYEIGQLKSNKLFVNQLKLILDIPIAILNKKLRQISNIEGLVREAQQTHLKKCGSIFCTHLLRFYESFRRLSNEGKKKQLKTSIFSIQTIDKCCQ